MLPKTNKPQKAQQPYNEELIMNEKFYMKQCPQHHS